MRLRDCQRTVRRAIRRAHRAFRALGRGGRFRAMGVLDENRDILRIFNRRSLPCPPLAELSGLDLVFSCKQGGGSLAWWINCGCEDPHRTWRECSLCKRREFDGQVGWANDLVCNACASVD